MSNEINMPVARDPLNWAKRATTHAALNMVITCFERKDSRFNEIVSNHIKGNRLWREEGVLKVGRAPRSNKWAA